MKRSQLISLTILFSVILICVTVLSVLCISTSRADTAVTEKYAAHVKELAANENDAQEWLSKVDAALAEKGEDITQADLPEGTTLSDGEITATITTGGVSLSIKLEILYNDEQRYDILEWTQKTDWSPDESMNVYEQ